MNTKRFKKISPMLGILMGLLLVVAVACAGEDPTPVPPTATPKPAPTATPVPAPTATLAPGEVAAPEPTATEVPEIDLSYPSAASLLDHPEYKAEWGEPVYGGVVKYRTVWPQTSNCAACNSTYRHLYVQPQYNTLVRYDPWGGFEAGVHPDLAKSWDISEDGLTYTFHLREGIKFRDAIPQDDEFGLSDMPGRGEEVTCEDAKASIDWWGTDEWGAEKGGMSRASLLDSINKDPNGGTSCPDGPDGYTLVVKTGYKTAMTMANFALPPLVVLNKEQLEWTLAEHPKQARTKNWYINMGTGPFQAERLEQDVVTKISKREGYWRDGLPFVDQAHFHVIKDFSTAFTAWASGQIDIMGQGSGSLQSGQVQQAVRDFPDKPLHVFNHPGGLGLEYNTNRPPFDNQKVRQAADMVLDRQEWVEINTTAGIPNAAYATNNWLVGDVWTHSKEEVDQWHGFRQPKDQDNAEALALMDEVYGVGGERPTVTCLTRSEQNYVDICLYAKAKWEEYLGLNVKLNTTEGVVERELALACNFDTHVAWPAALVWVYDPSHKYENYHSEKPGFPCERQGVEAGLQSKINDLIIDVDREMDPEKRAGISREIDKILSQEAYYDSALEYTVLVYGGQPWLKGVILPTNGTYAVHAWMHERYWTTK